jgi:hypothetical protein
MKERFFSGVLTRRSALIATGGCLAACASSPLRFGKADARLGPWDDAAGSFEHGDSARTSLFPGVDPFAAAGPVANAEAAPFATTGLWSVAFDRRGVGFALHGVLGGAGQTPRLSAFDPYSLKEIWRIDLPAPEGRYWNYPGGIGLLGGGGLYAVFATRIVRVDPLTGRLLSLRDLPAPNGAADTAYNGFVALSDGRLLTKSHHRKTDCPYGGYRAIIECGVEDLPPSALVLLDSERLDILWQGSAPEFVGGRVSAIRSGDREFVYLAGATSLHRLVYDGARLHPDTRWGPVRYVRDGETPGTAAVGFGRFVIVQNNAAPAASPLRLTVVSQEDATDRAEIRPFEDRFDGVSFMPSKPSADLANKRILVSEAHGALAAIRWSKRALTREWTLDAKSGSFMPLLGPASSRILVASDIGAARFDRWGAPVHDRERAIWVDAASGRILGEIPDLPRNFGLTLTPFADGSIYWASREGGLLRLRASAEFRAPR